MRRAAESGLTERKRGYGEHVHTISEISKDEYWSFLRARPEASYQQTPEWADARRAQWEPELIDWFDQNDSICAVTVLRYRRVPGTNRSFVFIPRLLDSEPTEANATAQVGSWAQGVFAAKSAERTNTRPSNALYWVEIRQAMADGAELIDIGGVKDALHEEDPAAGLVRFKAGLGADAYEYIGARDLPLQPQLRAAFTRLILLCASASGRWHSITARLSTIGHRRTGSLWRATA